MVGPLFTKDGGGRRNAGADAEIEGGASEQECNAVAGIIIVILISAVVLVLYPGTISFFLLFLPVSKPDDAVSCFSRLLDKDLASLPPAGSQGCLYVVCMCNTGMLLRRRYSYMMNYKKHRDVLSVQ